MNQPSISACILAGGQSTRMGQDKGLMGYVLPDTDRELAMAKHVANAMVGCQEILINSNQNLSMYETLGYPVFSDGKFESIPPLSGPLLGVLTALQQASHEWVLLSPCDSPLIPEDYYARMTQALENAVDKNEAVKGFVVFDGERRQNLHLLLHTSNAESLLRFLQSGERKVYMWLKEIGAQDVDFSDETSSFRNLNSPKDL